MIPGLPAMESTGQIIQLALAPVFLLVAIGQLLNVVTARLARVIDRSRSLAARIEDGYVGDAEHQAFLRQEMCSLAKRMRFANLATSAFTSAAVAVCAVVILLFVDNLIPVPLEFVVVLLFMLTMALITGGVISFLVEVTVATATLRINPAILRSLEEAERG